jgi:hydroxyacylglutathione hydrolase
MDKNTLLQVWPIPAFDDNYIWCIHDGSSALVVDPGDAKPTLEYLKANSLTLKGILITHHHADHTGGNKTTTRNALDWSSLFGTHPSH